MAVLGSALLVLPALAAGTILFTLQHRVRRVGEVVRRVGAAGASGPLLGAARRNAHAREVVHIHSKRAVELRRREKNGLGVYLFYLFLYMILVRLRRGRARIGVKIVVL